MYHVALWHVQERRDASDAQRNRSPCRCVPEVDAMSLVQRSSQRRLHEQTECTLASHDPVGLTLGTPQRPVPLDSSEGLVGSRHTGRAILGMD